MTHTGRVFTFDGVSYPTCVAQDGATIWVAIDGRTWAIAELAPPERNASTGSAGGEVRSPMPGTVIAVHVGSGDQVAADAILLIIEAMKMEHGLRAPRRGVVEVLVRVGDQVALDQVVARVATPSAG